MLGKSLGKPTGIKCKRVFTINTCEYPFYIDMNIKMLNRIEHNSNINNPSKQWVKAFGIHGIKYFILIGRTGNAVILKS